MVHLHPLLWDQIHGPFTCTSCTCIVYLGVKSMVPFKILHPVLVSVLGSDPWSHLHPKLVYVLGSNHWFHLHPVLVSVVGSNP